MILRRSQNSAFQKSHGDTKDGVKRNKRRRSWYDTSSLPESEDAKSITILPDTPLTIVFEDEADVSTPLRSLKTRSPSALSLVNQGGRRRLVFSPISPAPSSYNNLKLRSSYCQNSSISSEDHQLVVPLPVFKEIAPLTAQRKNLYMSMKRRKNLNIVRRSERISDAVENNDE